MNLMMLLEMAQSGFGDRVGLVSGKRRLRYEELFRMAGAAAADFLERAQLALAAGCSERLKGKARATIVSRYGSITATSEGRLRLST